MVIVILSILIEFVNCARRTRDAKDTSLWVWSEVCLGFGEEIWGPNNLGVGGRLGAGLGYVSSV